MKNLTEATKEELEEVSVATKLLAETFSLNNTKTMPGIVAMLRMISSVADELDIPIELIFDYGMKIYDEMQLVDKEKK